MSFTHIRRPGEHRVIPASDGRLTISVPIQSSGAAGGMVTLPNGDAAARPWDGEPTPLLAVARGHRWLAMVESGAVKSLREIGLLKLLDGVVSHLGRHALAFRFFSRRRSVRF